MDTKLIENVSAKLDIVKVIGSYVDLTKRGKNFWGICPFHQDSTPSMSVSPEKQIYKCFACGAAGGVINFVKEFEKISFQSALVKMAASVGIIIQETKSATTFTSEQLAIVNALNDALTYYQYCLDLREDPRVETFLVQRALLPRTLERFKIGFAPHAGLRDFLLKKGHDEATLINASLVNSANYDFFQNRIIFGVANSEGEIVAFSGRTLDDNAIKYLNSSESLIFRKSEILYNWSNAKDLAYREKCVYLCEGQLDVIALDQASFANAVAPLGTALTMAHLKLLKGLKVVLFFDSDNAGRQASLRAIKMLLDQHFQVEVVDPDLIPDKDASALYSQGKGVAIANVLEKPLLALEYVFRHFKGLMLDASLPEIKRFMSLFSPFLAKVERLEQNFYVQRLAKEFDLSPEVIADEMRLNFDSQAFSTSHSSTDKEKPVSKGTNIASYALVKNMLTKDKKFLWDLFLSRKNSIHFLDEQLRKIALYLATNHADLTGLNSEDLQKISEISAINVPEIQNQADFDELIRKINVQFYDKYIELYKRQLSKTSDVTMRNEIVKAIVKLQKAKKEEK